MHSFLFCLVHRQKKPLKVLDLFWACHSDALTFNQTAYMSTVLKEGKIGPVSSCELMTARRLSQVADRFLSVADLFHWSCLNELASHLPLYTAPAGYQCPTCQGPVFPPANLASPVADMLRTQLSLVNWARAGLGLPLVSSTVSIYPGFKWYLNGKSAQNLLTKLKIEVRWKNEGKKKFLFRLTAAF